MFGYSKGSCSTTGLETQYSTLGSHSPSISAVNCSSTMEQFHAQLGNWQEVAWFTQATINPHIQMCRAIQADDVCQYLEYCN